MARLQTSQKQCASKVQSADLKHHLEVLSYVQRNMYLTPDDLQVDFPSEFRMATAVKNIVKKTLALAAGQEQEEQPVATQDAHEEHDEENIAEQECREHQPHLQH